MTPPGSRARSSASSTREGIRRAHLVGNSLGGRIAIEVGLAAPERVNSLSLLTPSLAWRKHRALVPLVKLLRPELAAIPHTLTSQLVRRQFWSMFGGPDRLHPAVADLAVEEFLAGYRDPAARVAFSAAARNIYLEEPDGPDGFWTRLAGLQPPAMFVWGDQDPLVPLAFSAHVSEVLPDARQIVLNGCGHVPQVEFPEDTNGLLLDFIGSAHLPGPRPGGGAPGARGAADPRRAPAPRWRRRLRTGGLEPEHDRQLRPRIGGPMPATGTGAEARTEQERSRNGGDPSRGVAGAARAGRSLLGAVAGPIFERIQDRLTADLDDRDPDYIRENLPLVWLLSSLWFRGEVRDMGRIPEDRPVLLVGNHSGGNLTPDTLVFTLAFYTYFGVERRFHQLAHNLVLTSPIGPLLRRYGTVAASPQNARKALEAGAAVLVYPGGDWEVHRPSWQSGRVDFAGRRGLRAPRPRGRRADRARGLDRRTGDGALPQPRRAALEGPAPGPPVPAQGAAGLDRRSPG